MDSSNKHYFHGVMYKSHIVKRLKRIYFLKEVNMLAADILKGFTFKEENNNDILFIDASNNISYNKDRGYSSAFTVGSDPKTNQANGGYPKEDKKEE